MLLREVLREQQANAPQDEPDEHREARRVLISAISDTGEVARGDVMAFAMRQQNRRQSRIQNAVVQQNPDIPAATDVITRLSSEDIRRRVLVIRQVFQYLNLFNIEVAFLPLSFCPGTIPPPSRRHCMGGERPSFP